MVCACAAPLNATAAATPATIVVMVLIGRPPDSFVSPPRPITAPQSTERWPWSGYSLPGNGLASAGIVTPAVGSANRSHLLLMLVAAHRTSPRGQHAGKDRTHRLDRSGSCAADDPARRCHTGSPAVESTDED